MIDNPAGAQNVDSPASKITDVARRGKLETSVLLVIFNRLDTTARVFEAIREARPPRLYVAADGPRSDRHGEAELTEQTRAFVVDSIDWDCEVRTLFRSENLGSTPALAGAISWFFEHEEEGIILEDDCLPGASFFWYCEALLERYRDDERVMHIGGGCHIDPSLIPDSYYFSKYTHIWGWATWRESWSHFSRSLDRFDEEFEAMSSMFASEDEIAYWRFVFTGIIAGRLESWDYFWAFSVWRNNGLAIYPDSNLVKNIGFLSEAVNTKPWKDYKGLRNAKLESIEELRHPPTVELNRELDSVEFDVFYRRPPFLKRALMILKQMLLYLFEILPPKRRRQ